MLQLSYGLPERRLCDRDQMFSWEQTTSDTRQRDHKDCLSRITSSGDWRFSSGLRMLMVKNMAYQLSTSLSCLVSNLGCGVQQTG